MTETPKYTVVRKEKEIEIRQYAGHIQAEVEVEGRHYQGAIERGFNILAGYIFGSNISRQKIEMTTPVQAAQSEKIAMTTPVTVQAGERYTVAFIMPSAHTLDTLPQPVDQRIQFKQVPARYVAAVRFTGYFNQDSIQKHKQRLNEWLAEQGIETGGDFIIAGYNPPWVPGFLARNEVMIQIQPGT